MLKPSIVGKASLLHSFAHMRLAGICVVLSSVVACTTGSSGSGNGGTDATLGPPSEAGNTQLGISCSTFYAATGTFVPNAGDPPPANFTGCWPIGAWTFTLTKNADPATGGGVDTCTGAQEPTTLAKYQFTGSTSLDQDGDPVEKFTYTPQSSDPNVHSTIKVTEGGSGICEGGMSLFDSSGKKVWTLSPELNAE